jgi:hypothetical protein
MIPSKRDRSVYMKAYRLAHQSPEDKIKKSISGKKNYAKYKEKYKAYRNATRGKEYRDYMKNWRTTHKKERADYYAKHREEILAKSKKHHAIHRERYATYSRMYNYGLSQQEFDKILQEQGGVCAICGKSDWAGRKPYVDHDHLTKNVRGILCQHCNVALGHIKDDPQIARAMADYLEKERSR